MLCLNGANRHDSVVFEDLVDAIPITTPSGQGQERPAKLNIDKAYDIQRCLWFLHRRRIRVRIAQTSQRLRRHLRKR